jgi:hypothetical protein
MANDRWRNPVQFANSTPDAQQFSAEYRKGFEDAKYGALICCNQWREWDITNRGRSAQGVIENIEAMTPEKHAEFMMRCRANGIL